MAVKSIREMDVTGRRVFFRLDLNVPLDEKGIVKDDTRVRRSLPTIEYAISQGAKCILASHLGRPKGEVKPEFSLRPVSLVLAGLLGRDVRFVDDCIGPKVVDAVRSLEEGEVLLLENLRFHSGETKNDPQFAAELAALAEVYINDAFGTAHRAHASTVGIPSILKEKGAGLLLMEELENLNKAFSNPARPVVAIFGGAKVSDKLGILRNILARMDSVVIGGGMANTFLKAKGFNMGASMVEEDMLTVADEILRMADQRGCKLFLPEDVVVAEGPNTQVGYQIVLVGSIPSDLMALDIGPKTSKAFGRIIRDSGTIVWNGPMGVFESDAFKKGTMEVAEAVANSRGFSVVGGGDTLRAVRQAGITDKISYISTGGGAFMEFMEGKTLPGVAALEV